MQDLLTKMNQIALDGRALLGPLQELERSPRLPSLEGPAQRPLGHPGLTGFSPPTFSL